MRGHAHQRDGLELALVELMDGIARVPCPDVAAVADRHLAQRAGVLRHRLPAAALPLLHLAAVLLVDTEDTAVGPGRH